MSVSEAPVADGPVEGAESESFLRFLERHQKLLKLLEERSAVQAQLHDVRSRLEIAYGICVPRVAGEHSAYPVVGGSDVGAPGNLDDAQRGFSDHTERPKDEKDRGRHLLDTSVLLSEGDVSPPSGDGKKRPARAAVDGPVLSDAGARIAMDKLFLETKEDRARHEYLVYQKQRTLLRVGRLQEELRRWKRRCAHVRHAVKAFKGQYKQHWKAAQCEDRCKRLSYSLAKTESGIQVSLKRLAQQICRIFHLKLDESAPATLRGFEILRTHGYLQRLEALTSSELWVVGTSLGFLTHMTWLLARYLCIPLPHLLDIRSSRSSLRSRPPRAPLGYIAVAVDIGACLRLPLDDAVNAAVLSEYEESGGVVLSSATFAGGMNSSASCATMSTRACHALQPFYVSCLEKSSDRVEMLKQLQRFSKERGDLATRLAGPLPVALQTQVVLRGPMLIPLLEVCDKECGQQQQQHHAMVPDWLVYLGLMSQQAHRGSARQPEEAGSSGPLPGRAASSTSGNALLAVSWSALIGGGNRNGAAEASTKKATDLHTLPDPPAGVLLPLLSVRGGTVSLSQLARRRWEERGDLQAVAAVGGALSGSSSPVYGTGSPSFSSEARLPLYMKSNTASHRAQLSAALGVLQSALAQLACAYARISHGTWTEDRAHDRLGLGQPSGLRGPDTGAGPEVSSEGCSSEWEQPSTWPTLLFPVRRILAQEVQGTSRNAGSQTECDIKKQE